MDREDPPTTQEPATASSDDEISPKSPRQLPDDLPKSLDDRRTFTSYAGETEMYDAWQGECPHLETARHERG